MSVTNPNIWFRARGVASLQDVLEHSTFTWGVQLSFAGKKANDHRLLSVNPPGLQAFATPSEQQGPGATGRPQAVSQSVCAPV